ncbi:3-oxoacyl-[acyl-carrier-protein] synthase-1 [Daejeonella rubra]|uniref:3-oxoacyl-[acyl-carrier-protein] synthase 1 n=1 Tax=Daejeonella rubra TaxID=990371 RepID=A0A1G9Z544_9SPHI|nr:beta-ketoacyl synthase N-terminal-like domain-containing protein [Daejeonella rubra]SDN15851.1 3-oxoacyl-[acyl-carrier-protein] synthase-1 [Daejeonella rubra]
MKVKGRKVAIVGMGGTFPNCTDIADFNHKLFDNQSLIREWDQALAYGKNLRSSVSGFITEAEAGLEMVPSAIYEKLPEIYIDKLNRVPDKNLATADVGSIWAMINTLDAIKMAGWSKEETESEQTAVIMASGGPGSSILRAGWDLFFQLGAKSRHGGPHIVDRTMSYREVANVSCLIKNKGISESIISACATGLGNIGHAYRLISYGIQDRAITGGVEATSIEAFAGFDGMMILSRGFSPEESSRPFDKDRNGFVCSFGSGIVALEEYEMAKARGAKILAVIDGYFNNSDGDGDMFYPSFEGQKRLWKGLLSETGIRPDVVKVHGTSTPSGDSIELFGVVSTLGESGYHISAPKSQYGHMLGAAGAVELISSILMLENQKVLPCLNAVNLNPELERFQSNPEWTGTMKPMEAYRDLIPQKSFSKEINHITCLNYGFGGTNSSISISKDY